MHSLVEIVTGLAVAAPDLIGDEVAKKAAVFATCCALPAGSPPASGQPRARNRYAEAAASADTSL
jgi:hypothetical protein